ncbi:MAG: hypothetical protein WC916_03945 [Candidatus Woesearchaeota archaeon]
MDELEKKLKQEQVRKELSSQGYTTALLDIRHKRLAKFLFGLTYPFLGNLSREVQEDLENRLEFRDTNTTGKDSYIKYYYGGKLYYPLIATGISVFTNLGVYCAMTYAVVQSVCKYNPKLLSWDSMASGLIVIFFESVIRLLNLRSSTIVAGSEHGTHSFIEAAPTGSIIGKIISLPYEYVLRKKKKAFYDSFSHH